MLIVFLPHTFRRVCFLENVLFIRQPFPWRDHFVLTHAPIHPMCLSGRFKWNVHGHVHLSEVKRQGSRGLYPGADERYVNVCVEHTDFRPLHEDEVQARAKGISK